MAVAYISASGSIFQDREVPLVAQRLLHKDVYTEHWLLLNYSFLISFCKEFRQP